MNPRLGGFVLLLLMWHGAAVMAGDYDFIIPEAEKKPYELGGRLEGRYIYHRLNEDAARYRLNYHQDDPGGEMHAYQAQVELTGSYQWGPLKADLLTHHAYADTYEKNEWRNDLYEGYISFTPTAHLVLDAGKKRILWGKGYAWNPAGFLNPPKDPDDPALNQEGRTLLGLDLIKSLSTGGLANLGLTALLLPVIDNWANPEMGGENDLNAAAKLYLLWYDTDIDFIYFEGEDQPRSLGLDAAKNLAENIEVHAELAYRQDVPRVTLNEDGSVKKTLADPVSWLAGIRYLNAIDTTFIAEYYHNGSGYDRDALRDFFAYQKTAVAQWQATADPAAIQRAGRMTQPYYQQRNFAKDYFYLKISQKEPFDILYFTPWMTTVVNLQDFSFNLQPGMTWTPLTNLELNFRAAIPIGPSNTEFGEKQDVVRPECWLRYYF